MTKIKTLLCSLLSAASVMVPMHAAEITGAQFPRMDGSKETEPLRKIIIAKAFGLKYEWGNPKGWDSSMLHPYEIVYKSQLSATDRDELDRSVKWTDSHTAYMNLIAGSTDVIIVNRPPSPSELEEAELLDEQLTFYVIANDALVFPVGFSATEQPSFTPDELRAIFSGKQTECDGVELKPCVWHAGSDNELLFQQLVMGSTPVGDFHEFDDPGAIYFNGLAQRPGFISYTTRYADAVLYGGAEGVLQSVVASISGIKPNDHTIARSLYPYTTEIYAVVRADEPADSPARQLAEALAESAVGRAIVAESGYILPDREQNGIDQVAAGDCGEEPSEEVFTLDGVRVSSRASLPAGIYIVRQGNHVAKRLVR